MIAPIFLTVTLLAASTLSKATQLAGCDVGQHEVDSRGLLPEPTKPLTYFTLGLGFQNYTCNDTSSTYTNVGAIADIFDISCLYGKDLFEDLPDIAYEHWNNTPLGVSPTTALKKESGLTIPAILGDHYFVPNPITKTGISPKWDFIRTHKQDSKAVVVAARIDGKPAPEGKEHIDWVYLKNVGGDTGHLADEVYRTHTRFGQPPASCTPGGPSLQVKYVSFYWFTGGNVQK